MGGVLRIDSGNVSKISNIYLFFYTNACVYDKEQPYTNVLCPDFKMNSDQRP